MRSWQRETNRRTLAWTMGWLLIITALHLRGLL